MLRYIFILVCLLIYSNSQGQNKIDSLKNLFITAENEKEVCEIDKAIFNTYFDNSKFDSTIIYWNQIRVSDCKLTKRENVIMLYRVSYAFEQLAQYEQAITRLEKATEIIDLEKDSSYYLNIKSALNFNAARLYSLKGNEQKSLENYLSTIKILEELKDSSFLAQTFNNIGILYYGMGEVEKSNEAYETSIAINKAIGEMGEVARTLKNMAGLYLEEGILGRALEYLQLADTIEGPTIDKFLLFGDYYQIQKEPAKAIVYFEKAKEMAVDFPQKQWLGFSYERMAEAYEKLNKKKEQINSLLAAKDIYESLNLKTNLTNNYLTISNFYKKTKNYKESLHYYELHTATKDSLYKENEGNTIEMLNTMHEMYKVEKENEVLKLQESENAAQLFKQKNRNTLFSLITLFAILIAGMIYRAYQQKQSYNRSLRKEVERQTKALKQSNEELERFVFIASHDLKEPLRNIISYLTLIRRRYKDQISPEVKDYIAFAVDSGKHMYKLIGDILEHSRISQQDIEFEEVNLNQVMPKVMEQLGAQLEEKNAKINYGDLPIVYGRTSGFTQIFQNMIENGLKYNEHAVPKVEITYKEVGNYYWIQFKDNGIGIESQYYDRIFEMFKRLHSKGKYKGTGLGLPICKKLIEKYHGTIRVTSEVGKGSTFTISVPKELQKT